MLRLLAFQSYNWGYTPFMEPLPIGLLTLCYGNNGSGKTTYLTGIGLLLGVARLPTGHTYDRYVREGENWAFLKAVAANHPGPDGKRPFDQIIPDRQGHDTCTLACMLVYKAGEWKRSYYIVPGEEFQPDPEQRVDPSYSFIAEKYRASLQHVGIRPASLRLLELGITGLREIREPKRLFDFFVDLIGRETTRATYAQARREWRQARPCSLSTFHWACTPSHAERDAHGTFEERAAPCTRAGASGAGSSGACTATRGAPGRARGICSPASGLETTARPGRRARSQTKQRSGRVPRTSSRALARDHRPWKTSTAFAHSN